MEIVPKKNQNLRFRVSRARRGAALMYALLVVFILSLILLAMGGLVTSHFKAEENAATYSRLIYSAEAAANWQLLQVSRTVPNLPDGSEPSNPGAGFQTMSSLNTSPPSSDTDINADMGGIQIQDNVRTWVADTAAATWSPPNECVIYAMAADPQNAATRRVVSFHAAGTQLADRFTLFGRDSVTFNASGAQKCAIARGYVGSNGLIASTGSNPPQSVSGSTLGGFRGCLLTGPQAALASGVNWPTNIDYPHLPDPTILPSIDQVISYMLPGTDISALKTSPRTRNNQGRRLQIVQPRDHRDGDDQNPLPYPAIGAMVSMNYRASTNTFNSTQFKDLGPVTSLGEAQFSQAVIPDESKINGTANPNYYPPPVNPATGKPLRVIRLHAYLSDVAARAERDPNIFYFSNIQMKENDVLLLDVRKATLGRDTHSTTLRIVIHNNSLSQPVHITNVAMLQVTNADAQHKDKELLGNAAFIFYNDTNQPLSFKPTIPITAAGNAFYDSRKDKLSVDVVKPQDTDFPSLAFMLTPGCPGLAYGIRAANSALPAGVNDLGGSVIIDGSLVPCTVVGAIANQVSLIGNVTVGQPSVKYVNGAQSFNIVRDFHVEMDDDINRYVYAYHVTSAYQELNPGALNKASPPAYDYGSPPQ